ncbi:MAG: single-stranded-DNA-specific exonuclease RecJ [Motiliproteus sp.]
MNKLIVRRNNEYPLNEPSLPPLLQRIYGSRGIQNTKELERTLNGLESYQAMKGMPEAIAEIADAVVSAKRILIVGDFDCDGATSSSLAVLALRAMGAAWVDFLVPNRFQFGYGLSPEIVAVAAQKSPDLLITVDNGISSIEGVQAAKELGMRVVVTDHHLPGKSLPEADALVNPNQHGCDFPSKNLCGVGVIFYVMSALRRELQGRNWFQSQGLEVPNMASYLDLVALGTVADVVSLDQNNRILVEQGLRRIRAGAARPGILALLSVAGRDHRKLVASDLGFAVGPRLNAAGRLEDMSIGIECLLSTDADAANALAFQLDELNQDRKRIEQSMQDQALNILDNMALAGEAEMPAGLCLFDASWHEGVIGILASRIKERLHRPVIAFAQAEGGMIKGSARSIPKLHIRDALDAVAARCPQLLSKFGGHAMAAGMSLRREDLDAFSQAFDEEVRRQLNDDDFQARIESDGELAASELSLEMAQQLRDAGPWGQNFPEPLFDGVFNIVQQRIVGQRHLKLMLAEPGSGHCVDAIAFNVDTDVWPNTSQQARLAYKLDINEFRGRTSVQLMVDYLEPC